MQLFSAKEYLFIALANAMGYDKWAWQDRIAYGKNSIATMLANPAYYIEKAPEPILLYKAINAYRDSIEGKPVGYMMNLDATASGIQIMACLMNCHKTAANVNLINTGKREDVYAKIAKTMSSITNREITKDIIKKPVMTYFYGSEAQPKSVFGEGTDDLAAFYETLNEELPGATECMADMLSLWDDQAYVHSWTLPDGHTAYIPVMVEEAKKIEIDEMDHASFTHNVYVNKQSTYGVSIAANIVHSIDGYVVREMVRRAHKQGFELLTIHDSFWAHPNYMNQVRQNYNNILAEIAESDLLQDIARELTQDMSLVVDKSGSDLGKLIREADYALS